MSSKTNTNKRSFNRGGRGRGRGRRDNRRNYRNRKNKMELKPKAPEIKCRSSDDIRHEQAVKIEKMMQYYEDNEKTPVLPTLATGENKYLLKSMKRFTSKLYEDDGWTLEENEKGERYFTHPYSELKYPIIYKKFGKNEYLEVPGYREDSDLRGNSINKEPNRANPLPWYFSELTYRSNMNSDGSFNVEQNSYSDFWKSRRGKRRMKYHYYIKKRDEKKKLYESKNELNN